MVMVRWSHTASTYVFDTSKMLADYFKHLMVTDRFFYELDLISLGRRTQSG
jgi:hypothetical protein